MAADQAGRFVARISCYEGALRRLAAAYERDRTDQEDLFQEIALALWTALPRYRGEASERTWLYRIAHNVSLARVARRRRIAWREVAEPEAHHAPANGDAESSIIAGQEHSQLMNAVRSLPMLDRQIVSLYLDGLEYAEIEEITGLTRTNIGARLTRARQTLAQCIRRKGAEHAR